jgi:hypothetical protein
MRKSIRSVSVIFANSTLSSGELPRHLYYVGPTITATINGAVCCVANAISARVGHVVDISPLPSMFYHHHPQYREVSRCGGEAVSAIGE